MIVSAILFADFQIELFCLVREAQSMNLVFVRLGGAGQKLLTARLPLRLLLVKLNVAVAAGENSYANFCSFGAHFCCYGADAILVYEHCACRDGKRLRRTGRLLRKSNSQWGARKLLSNDSGSPPIAFWHAGSRLSRYMRHSSDQ